jgi:hypothetical protein
LTKNENYTIFYHLRYRLKVEVSAQIYFAQILLQRGICAFLKMNTKFKQRPVIKLTDLGEKHEEVCQLLLAIGEEWLRKKQLDIWSAGGGVKNKYLYGKDGLSRAFLRGLQKVMGINSVSKEQGDAVMANLRYIHRYGRKKWLECARLHRKPSDFYKWPKKGSGLLSPD